MRKILATHPTDWLRSDPIPINNFSGVLSAFTFGGIKVVQFSGPHTFYRAAGWDCSRKQMASAYGSWWADELVLSKIGRQIHMFENWLPKNQLQKAWPAKYRGATALCEDWNDMKEMYKLRLPPGEDITGLVGIAAPQPQRSKLDPKSRKTPMLQGGVEQVYFKRTHTLNSVNPLWVYSVHLW